MNQRFYLGLVAIVLNFAPSTLALPLSPGDRLEVSIPDDTYFARAYEVNQNGELEIPYLGNIPVVGLEPAQVQAKLAHALVEQGFFPPDKLLLSVQMLQWAPIQVTVAGETFQPGRVLINQPNEPQDTAFSPEAQPILGDYAPRRYLTAAIQGASGVLPTADVTKIRLIRGAEEREIDLSGIFSGEPVEDIPLVAGDQIIVPAADKLQPELVRPSQITPPGIKVFVSNLSVPASSNASSAIGNRDEGITFPYGSRFSQAVIATNCAGGIEATNAHRKATLVRVDRLTGETVVIDRKVEQLLRNSDNNEQNPLLMPRDGIACYDSSVSNTRDVFRTIADILSPFTPLGLLRTFFR